MLGPVTYDFARFHGFVLSALECVGRFIQRPCYCYFYIAKFLGMGVIFKLSASRTAICEFDVLQRVREVRLNIEPLPRIGTKLTIYYSCTSSYRVMELTLTREALNICGCIGTSAQRSKDLPERFLRFFVGL